MRFTSPRAAYQDANGNPLSGAKLNFYRSGTTTPQDTYSDEGLTVANTNPVVADSAGRFGDIFLQPLAYKVVLTDSGDVVVWTADPVSRDSAVMARGTTVALPLEEYLADPLNVKAFGARGDGSTDDTLAINAAMTAAAESGSAVFFPAGTYVISDRIRNLASMSGAAPGAAVIKASPGFAAENAKIFAAADITTGSDTINIPDHGFLTGDPVTWSNGTGTAPATVPPDQIKDGMVLWAIKIDDDNLKLAASENGAAIDMTAAGSGTDHAIARRRMMLDFNAPNVGGDRFSLKNLTFDINGVSGLNAWNSTSRGGGGGTGRATIEQVEIINGSTTAYAVEADSQIAEPGMLTGSVLNNFSTQACPLAMKLGNNMDDIVFNAPRFHANNASQGSETLPFLDLNCQNCRFNSTFIGGIRSTGYTLSDGSLTVRPLIKVGTSANTALMFNGLFIESHATASSVNLTHIFAATAGTNVSVTDIRINVEDRGTMRAISYQRITNTNDRGSWRINNVTFGSDFGNPFKRLVEADRVNQSDDTANGVSVNFGGLDKGALHGWPFGALKISAAGNQENEFFLDLHGTCRRVRYDHGMNEGNVTARKGERLYTAIFDSVGDVDASSDTLVATAHEFVTGDAVLYEDQGGTAPAGLANETIYFIIKVDSDTIKLATSQANAFSDTAINITADGVGATHMLTRMHKIQALHHNQPKPLDFFGASTSSPDDQVVRLPGSGVYLLQIIFKRDGSNDHQAMSTYLVYHSNGPTNDISNVFRLGTAVQAGGVNDVIVQSGPDTEGDMVLRGTFNSGPFPSRWIVTWLRLDWNH